MKPRGDEPRLTERNEMELTEHQKELIAALRSGKYPQTRGVLRRLIGDGLRSEGYCCLGVACVVAGIEEVVPSKGAAVAQFDGMQSCMPPDVVSRFGFRNDEGLILWGALDEERKQKWMDRAVDMTGNPRGNLIGINDNGGSFAFIADFLEACPEAVFVPNE